MLLIPVFAAAANAQTCLSGPLAPACRNLAFADDRPGKAPAGWLHGRSCSDARAAYSVRVADGPACHGNGHCLVLKNGFVMQRIDGRPYRGKTVVFHAAARTGKDIPGTARLFIRVHHPNGKTTFEDDMGAHPIQSSVWAVRELAAPVTLDALDIEFGLATDGGGEAAIDEVSFRQASDLELRARRAVGAFAEARNRHDPEAIASTFAESVSGFGAPRSASSIGQMLARNEDAVVDRVISSVDVEEPGCVIVKTRAWFPDPTPSFIETFVLGWEREGPRTVLKIQSWQQRVDPPYAGGSRRIAANK